MLQIFLVVTVISIFVFALEHYDRAAVGAQKRAHHLKQLFQITLEIFHICRVRTAYLHAITALKPPGQTAEFPLGTDVRPGADDDHEALLGGGP